jgi:DNA-binding MarR family transcriptional regulator
MTLSGRPLLNTARDYRMSVDRAAELTRLERALKLGMNAAVLGAAGSGKTSLLSMLQYRNRDDYTFVIRRAEGIRSAAQLLDRMRGVEDPSDGGQGLESSGRANDSLANLVRWKEAQEAVEEKRIVFAVDGLPVQVGRALFGALRDELWATQMQWVVTAGLRAGSELMQPPVDAFFESKIQLEPLNTAEVFEMIHLRGSGLDDDTIRRIASASDGNPRAVMDLVRYTVQYPDTDPERGFRARDQVISQLDPSARALIDELSYGEGRSASDPQLADRLGVTRPRISQLLTKLEALSLVRRIDAKTDQPGRPKVLFQLVPPQEYDFALNRSRTADAERGGSDR